MLDVFCLYVSECASNISVIVNYDTQYNIQYCVCRWIITNKSDVLVSISFNLWCLIECSYLLYCVSQRFLVIEKGYIALDNIVCRSIVIKQSVPFQVGSDVNVYSIGRSFKVRP